MTRSITCQEAKEILAPIGMTIGNWGQISYSDLNVNEGKAFLRLRAPTAAKELFCLSRHLVSWLPTGCWTLVQMDNSNVLDRDEISIFSKLFSQYDGTLEKRTYVIESGESTEAQRDSAFLIANMIFLLLLFEGHAYVTSSGAVNGEILGLQDGFAYFIARQSCNLSRADQIVRDFERAPESTAQWVVDWMVEDSVG
jgi:hypothetical protein